MTAIELLTDQIARLRNGATDQRNRAALADQDAAQSRRFAAEDEQSADEMQDALNTLRSRVSERYRAP